MDSLGIVTIFGEKKSVFATLNTTNIESVIEEDINNLYIYSNDISLSNVSSELEKYFIFLLKKYISSRVLYFQSLMQLKPKKIIFGKSLKNWGTCNSQGFITFNTALYKLSKNQIDYIIVHELAHLKHMNHDRSFWRLVGSVIKDYKTIMSS